jgi:hypothetical protein
MPNTPHNAPKSEAPDALHSVGADERIASSISDTNTGGNSAAVSGITPDHTDITNGRTNTITKNDGVLNEATVSEAPKPPFYWFTTHLNLPYLVLAALLVAT